VSEERAPRRLEPFGFGWPNLISVIRILLIPVIVWLVLREQTTSSWIAVVLYALGGLSDGLDGYLARRHDLKTDTGAWLDPLSDKLFVVVPAVFLSVIGEFPWWATAAFAIRELAVTLLRWYLDSHGGVSMPASLAAKAKTFTQLSAVGLAMMPLPSGLDPFVFVMTVLAVGLTLYTGAEYFLTTRHRVGA
jgi:CDP-diacylglycerol---glycerol-3-phosphate 3-phosphatidyltransferase